MSERKIIQECYIRICRDSGFKLSATAAAALAAAAVKISAFEVLVAVGFDNMSDIAAGNHPAAKK